MGDTKSEKPTLVTSQLFQFVCHGRRQPMSPIVKRSGACDTESEKHEPTRFFALKFDLCARSSIARMGNGKEGFRHGDPLLDNISQLAGSS